MRTAAHGGDASVHGLPPAAARRLSNQIARAFRGTYGAKTGLRTIVRATARQMLAGGSSPDQIAVILERFVMDHPACQANDPTNIVTGQTYSGMLADLMRQCVAETTPDGPRV